MSVKLRDGSSTDDVRLDLIRRPEAVDTKRYGIVELLEQPTDPDEAPLLERDRYRRLWGRGPVLDQGHEGACVGHAFANDLAGQPRRAFAAQPAVVQQAAFDLYHRALELDPFEGTEDTGTTLEAGAQAAIEAGHFREYRWAKNVDELIGSLLIGRKSGADVFGPAILALEWRDSMYQTNPDASVDDSGDPVGWHAIWAPGVNLRREGFDEPVVWLFNSWGPDWGHEGLGFLTASQLQRALGPQPEILIPVGRRRESHIEPSATTAGEEGGSA